MCVGGSAGEDKKGKEEEQSEYEFQVQESTLDFIMSMENRQNIPYYIHPKICFEIKMYPFKRLRLVSKLA